MKKLLLLASVFLACAACSKKSSPAGYGTVSFALAPDMAVSEQTKGDVSQYGTVPSVADFILTIRNYASEIAWTGNFTDFDTATKFAEGAYTAEVYSGNDEEEGIDKPCFKAVETFDIVNLETTPVTLKPALANCIVKVSAGNYVKNYFSSWSFTLTTGAGNVFQPSETDAIFIDAFKFDLSATFTKADGKTVEFAKTFTPLSAATCYNVVVDLDNVAGNAFTITFNNTVETITIEEELN